MIDGPIGEAAGGSPGGSAPGPSIGPGGGRLAERIARQRHAGDWAGDWDGVRNYEVKGSNSYSKMVARYRQDLLAVHAASEAAP